MLGDTHKFNMGKLHDLEIFDETVCELSVIIETVLGSVGVFHPGADMALIDSERLTVHILAGTRFQPARIAPLVSGQVHDFGSRSGTELRPVGIRICFIFLGSVCCSDAVFVQFTFSNAGNEQGPDAACIELGHGMLVFVPSVKRTDHVDRFRVGRPYGKEYTLFAVFFRQMRAELFVDLIMRSVAVPVSVVIRNEDSLVRGLCGCFSHGPRPGFCLSRRFLSSCCTALFGRCCFSGCHTILQSGTHLLCRKRQFPICPVSCPGILRRSRTECPANDSRN